MVNLNFHGSVQKIGLKASVNPIKTITNRVTQVLLDKFLAYHISGVARCNLTFPLESLSFFNITIFRMFRRRTVICVVYKVLIKLIWQKNGRNS